MKVSQPDIYFCDVCGKQGNEEVEIYKNIPVLSYEYKVTEYGIADLPPKLTINNFDLCEECLHQCVGIEYGENFCTPGFYNINLNDKNKKPDDIIYDGKLV